MRQKVREHRDTGGVMALALVAVILYSLWGASLLQTSKAGSSLGSVNSSQVTEQDKTLAVN